MARAPAASAARKLGIEDFRKALASTPQLSYLIHSEDQLLKDLAVAAAVQRHLDDGPFRDFNLGRFHGPEVDLDEVVKAAETYPAFASGRVVVIRDLDLAAAGCHQGFLAYLRQPAASTVVVATVAKPRSKKKGGGDEDTDDDEPAAKRDKGDKGGLTPAAVGALFGLWMELPVPKDDDAGRWLESFARARGARLTPDAITTLLDLVGNDLARLESEADKAILYAHGRERVELADVEAVTARTRTHTVWELTGAIVQADRGRALSELGILLEANGEPFQLLGILAFKLRQLLEGSLLVREGADMRRLGQELKVWGAELEPFYRTCRGTEPARAALALESLRQADDRLKSSAVNPRVLLEQTLVLAMAAGTTAAAAARPARRR